MNSQQPATPEDRANAVLAALEESDALPPGALDAFDEMTGELDWRNGVEVVARAWTDPEYRRRLLDDGTAACAEMGFTGPEGEYIVVVEDTPELKNVVVCTQCSCTAWPVLGLPPDWYKDPAYRSRVVREPRTVLAEMGLDLPPDTKLRVWDTTAETRYLVLPLKPAGTEGWTAQHLAGSITREAMIGVATVVAGQPVTSTIPPSPPE